MFETWDETIQRMLPHLQQIESDSIRLIQQHTNDTERRVICLNSTGKDSMVVTHLAEKAGIRFETWFNVTSLDVAESNRMAKRNGYHKILPNPKYGGFYQYIHRFGGGSILMTPNRLNRFCCGYFKEGPTLSTFDSSESILFLLGIRNEESAARQKYGDTTKNPKWGNRDWIALLPIREWTELDIWLYTLSEKIEINDKYRYGYSRVGCGIACPYYTKYTWVLDQYFYPYLFVRWRDILRSDFVRNNKWLIMNCTIDEYLQKAWVGGVYRPVPTDEVIREFADYTGLDRQVAERYFNRTCANGCLNTRREPLRIKDRSVLAMNMKLFGRDIDRFLCKKCLMRELNWDTEQWDEKVADFKSQGCQLF